MAKKSAWGDVPDTPNPPPAIKGDDTRDILHQAMGEAMAAWAILELHLAFSFYQFLGGNTLTARIAMRVFGVAEAFYLQRQMLQNAADEFFEKYGDEEYVTNKITTSHAKELAAYIARCVQLSEIRNKIAHGRIVRQIRRGRRRIIGWFLIPHEHDKNYTREGPSYAYTSAELKKFAEAFRIRPVDMLGMEELGRYVHDKRRRRWKKSRLQQPPGLGNVGRKTKAPSQPPRSSRA